MAILLKYMYLGQISVKKEVRMLSEINCLSLFTYHVSSMHTYNDR
jgi:hypothetical protein